MNDEKDKETCEVDTETGECVDESEEETRYPIPEDTEEVKDIYDELRSKLPIIKEPDAFVITKSISVMPPEEVVEIIDKIKKFDDFKEDSAHNIIFVTYKGEDYFFQFDWYGGTYGYRVVGTLGKSLER